MTLSGVRDTIADALRRSGVEYVFGLVGEDVVRLSMAVEEAGLRYVGVRHEATAIGMADGYARCADTVGVALISRGPGFVNCLSSLVTAAKGGGRVLVLAGDSDAEPERRAKYGLDEFKYVDQAAVLKGLGVDHVALSDPHTIFSDIERCLGHVSSRGLLVAHLPGDILELSTRGDESRLLLPADGSTDQGAPFDELGDVADLLSVDWGSRRPLIVAGRGAVLSDCRDDLISIGDRIGALLGTTLMGKGLFSGQPFDVGVIGTYASEAVSPLLADVDTVLAFGSRLHPLTTIGGELLPKAKFIHFDIDPGAHSSVPVEMKIKGDAGQLAARLDGLLSERGVQRTGWRRESVESTLATEPSTVPEMGPDGKLHPVAVMRYLDDHFSRERVVVVDNGHHMAFSSAELGVPDPRAFVSPLEFICVGVGTGYALGAALGRPDALTIYDAGDAGFLMSLGDIETAARYRIPVVIVVMNDQALGSETQYLRSMGLAPDITYGSTPALDEVARSLGADGCRAETLADFEQVPRRREDLDGPFVVDCRISREVMADWMTLFLPMSDELAT